jgi:hypothetical protein
MQMRRARSFALFVAIFALAVPPLSADAATPTVTIFMRNLNNPRGLNFDAKGALYVAEAGRGGTQRCPGGGPFIGRTGSISRLWQGGQQRIVTGLASNAAPDGSHALGPHDVLPMSGGRLEVTVGLGTDPAVRDACPVAKDFGWLVRAHVNGTWHNRIDLAGYEARANPDSGPHDSNPYGLLAQARTGRDDDDDADGSGNSDKNAVIATDAGGNSLLSIGPGNHIRTLATFPSRSTGRDTDSVPTSVARGPDGTLYVGELTGFPFTPGTANVYRILPGGGAAVFMGGFSYIIDIAFGSDGALYVLEHASGFAPDTGFVGSGNLWRVHAGTKTHVIGGLVNPTSVAIGTDGAFYISNCGTAPEGGGSAECVAGGGGHVLRVTV